MIVMPSNNSNAHKLARYHPGQVGLLIGPGGWRDPRGLPYALDNGRYAVWRRGKTWDEAAFFALLDKASKAGGSRWVVVPDVPTDADATFHEWDLWAPRLEPYGIPLAMAAQDGMTPGAIQRNASPAVVFVGGTPEWKRRMLWGWCRNFSRVHVGAINSPRWLWECHKAGAESCDGTGWYRGDRAQLRGLINYLKRSGAGLTHPQMELEFARTFGGFVPRETLVTEPDAENRRS